VGIVKPPAREKLSVILDGEEVSGFSIYGLTARNGWRENVFPIDVWPAGSRIGEFKLYGEAWEIPCWDVAVNGWPVAQLGNARSG
jgi:hypothetical protein